MKTAAAPSQSVALQPLRKAMVDSNTSTSMASLIAAQAIGRADEGPASVSRGLRAVKAGSDVKVLVGMIISYPLDYLVKPIRLLFSP
jgi:hypothetical protein